MVTNDERREVAGNHQDGVGQASRGYADGSGSSGEERTVDNENG